MAETQDPQSAQSWYIVPQSSGECAIVDVHQLSAQGEQSKADPDEIVEDPQGDMPTLEFWGPFGTKEEAIAKRVGLIRSGKCKPA